MLIFQTDLKGQTMILGPMFIGKGNQFSETRVVDHERLIDPGGPWCAFRMTTACCLAFNDQQQMEREVRRHLMHEQK